MLASSAGSDEPMDDLMEEDPTPLQSPSPTRAPSLSQRLVDALSPVMRSRSPRSGSSPTGVGPAVPTPRRHLRPRGIAHQMQIHI